MPSFSSHTCRSRSANLFIPCAKTFLFVVLVGIFAGIAQADDSDPINQKLLSMMNDMRTGAGLPTLQQDKRIDDAALLHLSEFVKNREIADRFDGEASLLERLRMAQVPCGSAGEIMFRAKSIDQVPELMKRSDMRNIILNSRYSLAGVAQLQDGGEFYIVANLVRPLQSLSAEEVENLTIDSLQVSRTSAKLVPFKISAMRQLRGLACDMAKKDSVKAAAVNPYTQYIGAPSQVRNFTFTTMDPGVLPADVQNAGDDPKINTASVGVCFAPSKTYPQGAYWVAIVLYGSNRLRTER